MRHNTCCHGERHLGQEAIRVSPKNVTPYIPVRVEHCILINVIEHVEGHRLATDAINRGWAAE